MQRKTLYIILIILFTLVIGLAWYWFTYKLALILFLFSLATILYTDIQADKTNYEELSESYRSIIMKLLEHNPSELDKYHIR